MTNIVDLSQERATRRPIVYSSVGDALDAAQGEILAARDLAYSALLLDSADVLDHLANLYRIVRACQQHVRGEGPQSHGRSR